MKMFLYSTARWLPGQCYFYLVVAGDKTYADRLFAEFTIVSLSLLLTHSKLNSRDPVHHCCT